MWRAAGPGLLHVLISDTPVAVNCRLLLYADRYLRTELESVRERLMDNRLSIHLAKTESILFATRKKLDVKLWLQLWNMRGAHRRQGGSFLWTRPTEH